MICVLCKIQMIVVKTGIKVRWRKCHVVNGDKHRCPQCKNEVVNTAGATPYHDEGDIGEFLEMVE